MGLGKEAGDVELLTGAWQGVDAGCQSCLRSCQALALPVLVQSRKYARVAMSATPIRTPSAMPMIDPTGRPVVLLL